MNKITSNQTPCLPSLKAEKQSTSHELSAYKTPGKQDLVTAKILQNFNVSHHVDAEELKNFKISLDVAQDLYSARDLNLNYTVNQMYIGDELTITLLKAPFGPQANSPGHNEQDFLCELICSGDTKTVFKININDKDFAIAIPSISFEGDGWNTALMETKSTEQLRQLGLNTIPFHKIVLAKVYGVTVPAIVMPLFTEIGGHIADHKNASNLNSFVDDIIVKNQITGEMLPVKKIPDEDSFLAILQHVIRDTGILVKNEITLGQDSINYQILDSGDVELFLFDLPKTLKLNCTQDKLCHYYANCIIICFYECIDNLNSLAFDITASNSKLTTALSTLINQAAEINFSESASS